MIAWIGDPFPLTCADVVFFLQLVYTRTLKGLSNLVPCVGCMVGVAMPEKAGEEGTWLPLRDKVIKKLCHACSIADKPPKTSRGDALFIFCTFLEILDLRGVSPADGANLFSSARRRDHRRSVCLSGDARTEEATGGEGRKETHAKSMTAILFPHSYLVFLFLVSVAADDLALLRGLWLLQRLLSPRTRPPAPPVRASRRPEGHRRPTRDAGRKLTALEGKGWKGGARAEHRREGLLLRRCKCKRRRPLCGGTYASVRGRQWLPRPPTANGSGWPSR